MRSCNLGGGGWWWGGLGLGFQTQIRNSSPIPSPTYLYSGLKYKFSPPANEVWGKVIFSVACVKNSVHGGEYLGRHPPGQVHPPRTGTPLGAVHTGRYGQQAGGKHPTGMHSS